MTSSVVLRGRYYFSNKVLRCVGQLTDGFSADVVNKTNSFINHHYLVISKPPVFYIYKYLSKMKVIRTKIPPTK